MASCRRNFALSKRLGLQGTPRQLHVQSSTRRPLLRGNQPKRVVESPVSHVCHMTSVRKLLENLFAMGDARYTTDAKQTTDAPRPDKPEPGSVEDLKHRQAVAPRPFKSPQKVSALLGLDKITAPSDNAEPDPAPRVPILVDDVAGVASMVDDIAGLPSNPPSLYCDVEGVNLSRKGTVSIMQVHAAPSGKTYLVDVHLLQRRAFSTRGTTAGARTLRQLLEDADVPKVFFDVRNDSDALYAHFGVRLRGVQDLQLMEAAARPRRGRRAVAGLAQCIQSSPRIPDAEKKACARVKQAGLRLFSPKFGGTHEVFNRRPLGAEVMLYCAQDVEVLPRLWEHYDARIGRSWKGKVASASAVRVAESQARGYKSDGPNRALLPVTWLKSSRFH